MTAFLAFALLAPHETRPGFLDIQELGPESLRVFWKAPARDDLKLAIRPRFPEGAKPATDVVGTSDGEFYVERYALACPGGLVGRVIAIEGLDATMTDVLVRFTRLDGSVLTTLLKPSALSFVVPARETAWDVMLVYTRLGVEHILLGIDHLLFVLGLLIIVRGPKRLLGTVTAFTAAHSLTLAAATLGWVNVPSAPVEAVIALSIVFVALEILKIKKGNQSLTERRPWVVAFAFGLLHGFGFAGALSEVGLPSHAIPVALLFFNVGVELGQLAFVGAAMAVLWACRRSARPAGSWVPRLAAYAIGVPAAFWTIERVAACWA